jgi:S-adenosylmethionine uptake transporter
MLKGIALGFAAYGLFATADSCIKALSSHYTVFEIIFFVTAGHFLTIGIAKPESERWREVFRINRPGLVALRALCGVGGGLCGVYAFTTLPMAEAYSLFFLMPAIATVMSIPILGESVGWRRWAAVGVGFLGVVFVVKPGFRELHLGHVSGVFAAFFAALAVIVLRILGPTEKRITLLATVYTAACTVNGFLMIPTFKLPALPDIGLMALAGLVGGVGQVALVTATRLAPANRVAPSQYSQIVWAIVFGAAFFGEFPDALALVGMALVAVSGLMTFLREEKLHGLSRKMILTRNRPDEL